MDSAQPPVIPTPASRRLFLFLKITSICVLIGLLHIPLALTRGVLNERQGYQAAATEEISSIWGRQQLVTGPVLAVPYAYKTQVVKSKVVNGRVVQVEETEMASATAYFLPDVLRVTGTVEPEVRHRGIYDAVVYAAKLKLSGSIQPDFAAAGIEADRIDWEKARVTFGVSDLHGVRSVGPIQVDGETPQGFESADGSAGLLVLEAKAESVAGGGTYAFSMEAALQGSDRLEIAPVGKTTTVKLESRWSDPSFIGSYLPVTRTIDATSFSAEWETAHFNRGFPASWSDRVTQTNDILERVVRAGFGVRFAQPLGGYGLAGRAQKYGVLFFVLVFAVFFLFEITAGVRIHPLQYAMVGVALCLFFLGFLALAEFWSVGWAYAVAAIACTLLISAYAWSFLHTGRRTLVIASGLGATYGYLYFVLKSQDYALVAGTVALFAALALVMFCTRKINWYALEMTGPASR